MHFLLLIASFHYLLLSWTRVSKAPRDASSVTWAEKGAPQHGAPRPLRSRTVPVQMTKEELVQSLRRQSKGYHQNSSQYRGVTKHQKGKWEARIGQV